MHEIYLSYQKVLNLKDDTFERGAISTFYNGKSFRTGKDWTDMITDSSSSKYFLKNYPIW